MVAWCRNKSYMSSSPNPSVNSLAMRDHALGLCIQPTVDALLTYCIHLLQILITNYIWQLQSDSFRTTNFSYTHLNTWVSFSPAHWVCTPPDKNALSICGTWLCQILYIVSCWVPSALQRPMRCCGVATPLDYVHAPHIHVWPLHKKAVILGRTRCSRLSPAA